ncbi:MAG: saccharopine dehydrogenase C-terminal domain-containing protein [Legionellaceae bacterium]|nr:saccharopine dehydrogenase C-terminal domain-containing protein [Legionellaceae bacterium]
MMIPILVAGAGKIGSLIACLLVETQDYEVHLADLDFKMSDTVRLLKARPDIKTVCLDVKNQAAVQAYLKKHGVIAVISSLPYFLNVDMAEAAKAAGSHYFDLTEAIAVAAKIKALAHHASTVFVPQCGLAPGFVSMVAHGLLQKFDVCHTAKLRVGALPQNTSNALHYSLTWSTEGLINEYGELCTAIQHGKQVMLAPLEGLESLQIDGDAYEAFHTSGGLGGLGSLYEGKIQHLDYKTIRHPGHCEKMRFLMHTLQLNQDRKLLKQILERAIPKTYQDRVLIYVSVEGIKQGELIEESYVKNIYPKTIAGITWSAIQVCTASSVCAVLELVLQAKKPLKGLVLQEHFDMNNILKNRFGRCYA